MDLKATYNRIAEDWTKDHAKDDWWVEGTDTYLSLLPKGSTLLDAGCGGGEKSNYILQKGFNVTGIDFSEKMIEIAARHVPPATFLMRDIRQPLELPGMYDGVFAQAILLHIPKKDVVPTLKNLLKVLKPDGLLYAAVKRQRPDHPGEETVREDDYGYPYERFFSFFTPEELKKYFVDAGLEVIHEQIEPTGDTKWLQLIGKKLA